MSFQTDGGRITKGLGHTAGIFGVIATGFEFADSKLTNADRGRASGLLIAGSAFIPRVGPAISIGLGIIDSFGGLDPIYK